MITIDMHQQMGTLHPIWNQCVGAGRAKEGLRADWQRHLTEVKENCGFRYLRFHGLLHDDMFVYREENGKVHLNFQYVDALFDFLLDAGIRPFVEFGFMPADLARETATIFWWKGNGAPPVDEKKWTELIVALIRHWMDRYGKQEVLQWYFEVWNEPNLHLFFRGTKSEYFRLYQITALAVKSVDQRLRVGGPATSNFVPDERFDGETEDKSKHLTHTVDNINTLHWHGVWIQDFLKFCKENHLPLDFVSTHLYPTDFALDGHGKTAGKTRYVTSLREDLEWLHRAMQGTPYECAEIHLTEWSSSPSSRDFGHDYLPAAAYVVKCNLDVSDLADSLSYWTFTDVFEEAGGGPTAFHGGFGLVNMQGIRKPTFYAYQFLNRLGDQLIEKGDGYAVTKKAGGKISAVFYHYPEDYRDSVPMSVYPNRQPAKDCQDFGVPHEIQMTWNGLNPGSVFWLETVTRENVAIDLWEKMGQPGSPTPVQVKLLQGAAGNLKRQMFTADESGRLNLSIRLNAWEIASLVEV